MSRRPDGRGIGLGRAAHLRPVAQLKRTAVSLGEIWPLSSAISYAASVAAPSGHSSSPSCFAHSSAVLRIRSSSTIVHQPSDSRTARMMRKSPTAMGTRMPEAAVAASFQSGACSLPSDHALTMGAQPLAWTQTIFGSLVEAGIQPISCSSLKAFHMPISPVPPPDPTRSLSSVLWPLFNRRGGRALGGGRYRWGRR